MIRIMDKEAGGGKYWKKKAKVLEAKDEHFVGLVETLEGGSKL